MYFIYLKKLITLKVITFKESYAFKRITLYIIYYHGITVIRNVRFLSPEYSLCEENYVSFLICVWQ